MVQMIDDVEVVRMEEVRVRIAHGAPWTSSHECVEGFAGSCKSFSMRSHSARTRTLIQIEFRFRPERRTSHARVVDQTVTSSFAMAIPRGC
jgi:hypothetical protein